MLDWLMAKLGYVPASELRVLELRLQLAEAERDNWRRAAHTAKAMVESASIPPQKRN